VPTRSDSALEQVKRLFSSENGRLVERITSPHTHPGGSVWRTAVQKARVLITFVARRLLMGPGRKDSLASLRALAGSCQGKEVLVIGSGPSAEKLNLHEVKKRQSAGRLTVIATNYFLHSQLAKTVSPDYLVWADDVFDPSHHRNNSSQWQALEKQSNCTLVAPWWWRESIQGKSISSRAVYFDNDSLEGWSRNISPLHPRGYQGTTGVKALAVALHLEPSAVLLIGLDLSYYRNFIVDSDNRLLRQPSHVPGTDSGTQDIGTYSVHGLADALYSTANQFLALHTHFAGRSVINLDPDSLVDAFPKASTHAFMKQRERKKN